MGSKRGVSVPGEGRDRGNAMALRDLPARRPGDKGGDDGSHGDRDGLLVSPVQQRAGRDDTPFALLLSFTRHLVRNTCGGDAIWLALSSAMTEQNASQEQMKILKEAVFKEHARGIFPEGF